MRHALLATATLAAAAACGSAQAQASVGVMAYTAKPVNLRAGPAREYPIVAVLPAGLQVSVQGCLSTYAWCDVIAGYERGWVYAGNLRYPYENHWQPLISWAPVIGIAVLPFVFDDYWQQHYWNRPWYSERWRWQHVPPPRFAHPRPVPREDWRRPDAPPSAPHPREGWRAPAERPATPHPPEGWHPQPPGQRHERPRGAAPTPPAPGTVPAPQAQPPAPPRPPGWRPEPRVGPVPRAPQSQQPQRHGPRGDQHGPRGERDGQR